MLAGIFSTNKPFFSPLRTRRVRRVRRSLLARGGRGEDCGETSGEDGADLGNTKQHSCKIIDGAAFSCHGTEKCKNNYSWKAVDKSSHGPGCSYQQPFSCNCFCAKLALNSPSVAERRPTTLYFLLPIMKWPVTHWEGLWGEYLK